EAGLLPHCGRKFVVARRHTTRYWTTLREVILGFNLSKEFRDDHVENGKQIRSNAVEFTWLSNRLQGYRATSVMQFRVSGSSGIRNVNVSDSATPAQTVP